MQKYITSNQLVQMKKRGEKFTGTVLYDASFANKFSKQGVEVLVVGDSVGMCVHGNSTTVPVTMVEMVYHTACVQRGNTGSLLIADLPYMSYATPKQAFNNAAQLMQAGAHMIKMEGGHWLVETVRLLTERGIPVCAHLGLTPQSFHKMGGYRIQGREAKQATKIIEDAKSLQLSGAELLVLECVPTKLAKQISEALVIPTIGAGAGAYCDGQVLNSYDILGISDMDLKFSKNFLLNNKEGVDGAIVSFINAVKNKEFPAPENSYD